MIAFDYSEAIQSARPAAASSYIADTAVGLPVAERASAFSFSFTPSAPASVPPGSFGAPNGQIARNAEVSLPSQNNLNEAGMKQIAGVADLHWADQLHQTTHWAELTTQLSCY